MPDSSPITPHGGRSKEWLSAFGRLPDSAKVELVRCELDEWTAAFDHHACLVGSPNRRPDWAFAERLADEIALLCAELAPVYSGASSTPRDADVRLVLMMDSVPLHQREQPLRDRLLAVRELHRTAVEAHNFVAGQETAEDMAALAGELAATVAKVRGV